MNTVTTTPAKRPDLQHMKRVILTEIKGVSEDDLKVMTEQ